MVSIDRLSQELTSSSLIVKMVTCHAEATNRHRSSYLRRECPVLKSTLMLLIQVLVRNSSALSGGLLIWLNNLLISVWVAIVLGLETIACWILIEGAIYRVGYWADCWWSSLDSSIPIYLVEGSVSILSVLVVHEVGLNVILKGVIWLLRK